jgi:hypothetical protein
MYSINNRLQLNYLLLRVGILCVTYKTGFGLDDWIYYTLYIHTVLGTTANTALSLVYALYKRSQSSLVVPLQRIYNRSL